MPTDSRPYERLGTGRFCYSDRNFLGIDLEDTRLLDVGPLHLGFDCLMDSPVSFVLYSGLQEDKHGRVDLRLVLDCVLKGIRVAYFLSPGKDLEGFLADLDRSRGPAFRCSLVGHNLNSDQSRDGLLNRKMAQTAFRWNTQAPRVERLVPLPRISGGC